MNYLKYVIDNIRSEDYTPEEYYWKVVAIIKEFGSYHTLVPVVNVPMAKPPEPEDLVGFPNFHHGNKPEDGSNLKESDGIPKALVTSPQASDVLFGTQEKLLSGDDVETQFTNMLSDAQDRRYPHYEIPLNLLDSLQDALCQLPNTELDNSDYPDTYTLASRLEYIVGKAKHNYWQRCRRDAGMSSDYDIKKKLYDDAVKTIEADGLKGELRTYGKPTMNLYHWSSKLLAAHGEGDIIVMAENKEQARQFAEIQGHRYILENNAYLTMLRENEDPDYDVELDEELQVLRADLAAEPVIIPSGVILIPGSD